MTDTSPVNSDTSVFSRLREERQRLNKTQDQVAQLCGVSKRTVIRWEQRVQIPAEKLALLMSAGFDAGYVLDGVRAGEETRVKVTPDELSWLWKYKTMSPASREQACRIVDALVQGDTANGRSPRIRTRDDSTTDERLRDPAKPRDPD